MTRAIASRDEVAAFSRVPGRLVRIEWRDGDGVLVARHLAETVTLARGVGSAEVRITVSVGDALSILEDAA